MGSKYPTENGQFWGFSAHWKARGVAFVGRIDVVPHIAVNTAKLPIFGGDAIFKPNAKNIAYVRNVDVYA